jgi:hypothetical protein
MVSAMGSGGTLTLGAYALPPNPVPTIMELVPSSVSAGHPDFTLVIRGTGFVQFNTRVGWNGATRYPTVVHPGRLDLSVDKSDVASAGTVQVTASNPAPGGGVSAPAVFTITRPLTATSTYITSSPNPSRVGQLVTFTASVYPAAATGAVGFKEGSTTIGSASLASGRATFGTSGLPAGVHGITAEYLGDAEHAPSASSPLSQTVVAVSPGFFTLMPCRAVDTRNPAGPQGGPALVAGVQRTFPLAGQCGIPTTAAAVSVNLTVTEASAAGNLRLYPAGIPVPLVSTINYSAAQTRANNAIVPLNDLGEMAVGCSQAFGTVHFILDVNGYFQ